jgi:hypothetical protein
MRTLLFVHGTGVRKKAFDATLETITAKAAANLKLRTTTPVPETPVSGTY